MSGSIELEVADVYVIGYGHRLPNHLTLEAIAALRRCQKIYAVPPVRDAHLRFPPMVDLRATYSPERCRRDTYREMANVVIEAAKATPPVGLITFGSAVVGSSPCHLLITEGPAHGLRVKLCAGVSCLEGIWSDLNIDPFDGFLVWDATTFLALQAAPPPAAHLLLTHVPFLNILTGPDPDTGWPTADLIPLRDHLLNFYPREHVVSFVRTASFEQPAAVRSLPLGELSVAPIDLSSLFVPRCPGSLAPLARATAEWFGQQEQLRRQGRAGGVGLTRIAIELLRPAES